MTITYTITVEATGENEAEVRRFAENVLRNSAVNATKFGRERVDVKSTGWKENE